MQKKQKIRKVATLLNKKYPPNNLGNKKKPLNELLYIIISLRTTNPSLQRTYRKFKKIFPKWENVYESRMEKIVKVLKNAGLSKQKARNLKSILKKIKQDWGVLSLSKARQLNDEDLEKYLRSLPGLGLKSARCIMMYSFGREVFPVDSHCFRIIRRLGWISSESKYYEHIQNYIQELIPPKLRYRLHVNLIQHGRKICFPYRPRCKSCFLQIICQYGKSTKGAVTL